MALGMAVLCRVGLPDHVCALVEQILLYDVCVNVYCICLEALPEAHRVEHEHCMFLHCVGRVFFGDLDSSWFASFWLKYSVSRFTSRVSFGGRFVLDVAPRWWTLHRPCVMLAGEMHFIISLRIGKCASACPCCPGEILTTICFCMPAQETVDRACNFGWAEALT